MGLLDKIKATVAGAGIKTTGSIFKDLADGIGQFINKPEDRQKALEFIETKKLEAEKESNRHEEVVLAAAVKETENYLQDVAGARSMQIEALRQNDRIAKLYIYYLASFIIVLVLSFDMCLFWVNYPPANRDMINSVSGILNAGALIMVLSFFFGSSKSSGDKQNTIETLIKNKQE